MPVPDAILWLMVLPADLWSYVGLGPGQEFIPQFLAMLGLALTALLAVVQWPVLALWSRLRRTKPSQISKYNRTTDYTDNTDKK